MKLLLNECALKFETKEEFVLAIKIASEMLDVASDHKKMCEACEQEEPIPFKPVQTAEPEAEPIPPATDPAPETEPVPPATGPAPEAEPLGTAPIPTAAPTYTIADLQKAAQPLMDAGGEEALRGLLAEFNVAGLAQLPTEQIGAFATKLRAIGGKI